MKRKLILAVALIFVASLSLTAFNTSAEELISTSFISQTPDPVEPGDYVELRWKVDNTGSKSNEYIFELEVKYPFSLDESETAKKSVGSLTGYQTLSDGAIIYWKLRVAEDAVEGTMNKVKLKYWEKEKPDLVITGSEQIIRVQSKQGLVDIEEVKITPEEVEVGTMFDMKVKIDNKGTGFISNVKLTADTASTGFTPVDMTSQKTVKRIPGQSSQELSFRFFVDTDTSIEVNRLPLTITYSDKFGTEYSTQTIVGIPVVSKPAYLTNLEDSDIYIAGNNGEIVVSVSNIGKDMLNFLVLEMVETDNYEIISTQKTYLGNLESDDFETGQFNIFLKQTKKKEIPLKFKLHFRDSYDKVYQEDFTLSHKLYTAEEAAEIGLVPRVDYTGNALVAVIIIAIVVLWLYRRRCKKKCKRK